MTTTINGRTPEEIKKGLECCNTFNVCHKCPYEKAVDTEHGWGCVVIRNADTLAYIQQLERERDSAVRDIVRTCRKCAHREHKFLADGKLDDLCGTCLYNNMCNWQWRGVEVE